MLRVPLPDAPPPQEAHARLAQGGDATFLLESREGPARLARYSLVGFAPVGTVSCTPEGLQVTGGLPAPSRDQEPLTYLRRIQAFYATDDDASPFVGGLVGTIGHDFVRLVEPGLDRPGAETWPRFHMGVYLDGLVYDHEAGTVHYVSRGEDRSQEVARRLAEPAPATRLRIGALADTPGPEAYRRQVEDAKGQIAAGEAFQIVLSRSFTADCDGSLAPVYDHLREAESVPYLYWLRFPRDDLELLGASPEMLVRVRGGVAETDPIAGTRPVTGDEQQDARMADELRADPKERAEHAMLVDLARNDLGRVAATGSVRVEAYQEVHAFRRVQHLVSRVAARLADGCDALDALAAVFPAGTVSGAPKLRALEHIDRIEGGEGKAPRGPYAGAVAYHSFNGSFDSAICIRSASKRAGRLTIQAGAGITVRSDPTAEEEETRHKAASLLEAIRPHQEDP